MVKPDQIIKGDVTFTLDEFYKELRSFVYQIKVPDEKKKEKGFHSLFMFIMLSAEDKSMETMTQVFNFTKEQTLEQQEVFKEHIDVCRAIHMRKFLDMFSEYMGGTSITLRILNLWIKDFLNKHIRGVEHGTT